MEGVPTAAAAPAARPARTLSDRILGAVGGAMILLALGTLVVGGESDSGPAAAVSAPRIRVADPQGGEVVRGPLQIIFHVDADLQRQPSGWGTGDLHLHLQLDRQSFMPAATDIQRLPSGAYRWDFGPLGAGTHRLRLFWSDASHREISAGGSPLFEVHAR